MPTRPGHLRRLLLALATTAALAAAALPATAQPPGGPPSGPRAGQVIPGQFIVELAPDTDPDAVAEEYRGRGAQIAHVYRDAIRGFAGRMSDPAVREARADRRVVRVEQDRVIALEAQDVQTQPQATWGLDRIDQRERPMDGSYTYQGTGGGVTAYVVDTGIRATHVDFGGRVRPDGFTAIGDGRGTTDCNGHGTHVAGTVGGSTYGVAKGVTLVAVRVLGCNGSGSTSGVIAGVDYVAANASGPAVANMSLGGGASTALDNAVRSAVAAGVTFVVAAGNSNANACNASPARTAEAITVGATTNTDARASYSNVGTCLDLFAPGSAITAAWSTSDTATNTISGTSMAAPHVAGVAALRLEDVPGASPEQVGAFITEQATPGKVTSAGSGSPNLLLFSPLVDGDVIQPPPAPEPVAPTAGISTSCSGTSCTYTSTSTGTPAPDLQWTRADGSTAGGGQISASYPQDGTFTVTLTATNGAGSDTATATVTCRTTRFLFFTSRSCS